MISQQGKTLKIWGKCQQKAFKTKNEPQRFFKIIS
jgi:hypothetical protein